VEQGPLSSPSRHLFSRTREVTSKALHQGELYRVQADSLTRQVHQFTTKKPHNRKRIQKGGALTAEMAQEMIRKKDEEEAKKKKEAEAKMLEKIVRREAKALHDAGIIARRCEGLRRRVIIEIGPEDCGAVAFLEVIPDPEAEAKLAAAQPMRLPSSPPPTILSSPPIIVTIGRQSWLDDDVVPLDQEGSIIATSDIESSSEDEAHL
jgi:hypothetical protein